MALDIDRISKAVVDTCSYHRLDYDLVLVRTRPHEMQAIQTTLQTAFPFPQPLPHAHGLGSMGKLPGNLIMMIIRKLDILSHFRFRHVNRLARFFSTMMREYSLVARHGPEGLRGLLRAGLAYKFTVTELYDNLVAANCTLCGAFGGFLFLLTNTRCCFDCVQNSSQLRVASTDVLTQFTPNLWELPNIVGSILRPVPGLYRFNPADRGPRDCELPTGLVTEKSAIVALRPLGIPDRYLTPGLEERHPPLCRCSWCPKDWRYMASTAFPWYSLAAGAVEHGVNCKGCYIRVNETWSSYISNRDRVYSTAGFLLHFAECKKAQDLWLRFQIDRRLVEDPMFVRRGGILPPLGCDGRPQ